jgi:hypothetical protein
LRPKFIKRKISPNFAPVPDGGAVAAKTKPKTNPKAKPEREPKTGGKAKTDERE